jgi:hypothetical protein
MSYKITNSDYSKILAYYGLDVPKKGSHLKDAAENILSQKLCSCIKKVGPSAKDEQKAIGVCTKTVLNRKGFSRGKFKCKNGRKLELKKTARKITIGKKKTQKSR